MNNPKQNILATLSSVAVFLGLFAGLQWSPLVAIALSVGTYFGVYFISKPKQMLGGVDLDMLTDGLELKELTDEAERDLAAIEATLKKILDPDIQQGADQLHKLGNNIMTYLKTNPEKISKARRFFRYYLETARQILDKYQKLESTRIESDELTSLRQKTTKALGYLSQGFRKQYLELAANDLMDIDADLELLEKSLKEEGY